MKEMSPRYLVFLLLAGFAHAQLFQPSGSVPLGTNTFYAVADFNLDGRLDIARASAGQSEVTLSLGNTDGSFTASGNPPVQIEPPTALIAGDFDHDGKTDLVVLTAGLFSEPRVRVLINSGSGVFTPRPGTILSGLARVAAVADFDLDGNLDVAVVTTVPSGASIITVFRGNGSGDLAIAFLSIPVSIPVPNGSVFGDMQVADLNGDLRPDLIMTVSSTSGVGLAAALGTSAGTFTVTATMGNQPPLSRPNPQLAIADFNGDRRPDVVMFGYLRDQVTLWTNSAGTLIPQLASSSPVGANPYAIAAADFDLDGRMDWAVGRQTSTIAPELHVALGNGAGAFIFAVGSPFPYGGPAPLLETGDFNGDRRQDLLVVEGDVPTFRVLLNVVPRPATLLPQQIDFSQPPDRGLNDGPVALTATATSGLPVVFAGTTNAVCTVSKGVVSMVALGTCTVIALQQGDQFYSPAPMVQRSFTVARNVQTLTFAALADRTLDAPPFTVSATSSAGLPVTFTASPANVCVVTAATVTLVGLGQCSITASQPGNTTFPAATPITRAFTVLAAVPVGPRIESIANAASYALGTLSPASYGVLFGIRLTGGVLRLRDATGTLHSPELIFSGATQINFIVPAAAAQGSGSVTVTTTGGAAEFPVTIAPIAPGLFSSNGSGQGPAAAQALILNANGTVTTLTVADGPIPVLAGTEVYLVLYGTGIRGRTPAPVFATVAGRQVEVLYAGPQGTFPALDQVNVRVPLTVAGSGIAEIRLVVDGLQTNVVLANFQ